jgi:nitronate monooxygenase
MLSVAEMRAELALIRAATDRPFNVNFFCHEPTRADAAREAAWLTLLAGYYAEFGVEVSAGQGGGAGRAPFSSEAADAIEEFKPAVVSFHFGLPSEPLMSRVRRMGSKIFSSATTVAEARWLEERGVDAIIAQGYEAGGHRGMFLTEDLTEQVGTFALLPQVVSAVKVPVIAAGGIVDAAGVRAAMELGAAAVQVGTAYLLCPETTTKEVHRVALKSEAAGHTAVTNVFSGRPARGIVNRIMRELGPMCESAPGFPWAGVAIAPLRAAAERVGSGDFSSMWCGQNASGCLEISAGEVTRRLAGL